MGITGLIPFLEKASRRANVDEFSGCTVAIDTYCWLHKGAFSCAEKLVRGEDTDAYIKYCLKYVTMLLTRNIKPILVFDGRHLPAKAMTETKRRESRDISKKRAAELLSLGRIEEARSFIRRSVDITHQMALALIKECRKRNVDCIVAPYEADAQLAHLNIKNYAQLVITEDSDLILFGCTKVLFKMDLDGTGTLVETAKLPLVMKCPIESYKFDKFRQMCIMSGCDYLASLPGIGLAKARQFVTATQDSNFANALRKLPSFFNRSNLTVTDEYRENFLKAEATFKHQYVYDPIERQMVRLTDPDDEDIELALCGNAGELLEPKMAYQLALGNIEPFTLKILDDWDPDHKTDMYEPIKTISWKDKGVSNHPSIWKPTFKEYLTEPKPWVKKFDKLEPIISIKTRTRKVVTLFNKIVPETQDESLSIEALKNMYCVEPANKKQKIESEMAQTQENDTAELETDTKKSPILENKRRSFKKYLENNGYALKKLSRFPRTVLDSNIIESKFFNGNTEQSIIDESPEKCVNPLKVQSKSVDQEVIIETDCDSAYSLSQKENSLSPVKNIQVNGQDSSEANSVISPKCRNPFKCNNTQASSDTGFSESVDICDIVEDSQSPTVSPVKSQPSLDIFKHTVNKQEVNDKKKSMCRVSGLKRTNSVPTNQSLLSKFGFQRKPVLKR